MLRLADFETFASENLAKDAFDYFHHASEDRVSFNDNLRALKRCVTDVSFHIFCKVFFHIFFFIFFDEADWCCA